MTEKAVTTTGPAALQAALSADLVDAWLDYERKVNEASQNTIVTYRRGMGAFLAWVELRGLDLGTLRPDDVADFKTDQAAKYSPQTINLSLTAVRSFYRWALATGHALLSPATAVRGVKRSKSRAHKRDALTNGEVARVLATCEPDTLEGIRDAAILSLFAHCALRAVEVHRANIGDLRTKDDRLVLFVSGKGHTDADDFVVIPLSQEPAIREWLKHRLTFKAHGAGDPLFVSLSNQSRGARLALRSIRDIVKTRYHLAGVVGDTKTTHSLRHSAITNAIRHGAQPLQVQQMARHQSFDTTLVYYHETSRLAAPAEDLIDYGGNAQQGEEKR